MFTQVSDARSDPEFSLVVPCYNEEAVVSHTIGKLLDAFQRAGYRLELILVDNGSTDRTGEILRGWADRNPAVVHYKVEKNEGYGNGVLSGLAQASAPWVGSIPADGQVDAEDVVRLYEVVRQSDTWVLAKVRRRFRLDGMLRKIVSTTYNVSFRVLWPTIASVDVNGSPKIMPREALPAMALQSKDWFLDPEIMIKAHTLGMRVLEFNVFARLRGAGVSHVKPGTCWEFFRNLLKYRFTTKWKRELIRDRSALPSSAPVSVKS
jgi:glycosyltransferase involved in cell wall biosynthesis